MIVLFNSIYYVLVAEYSEV